MPTKHAESLRTVNRLYTLYLPHSALRFLAHVSPKGELIVYPCSGISPCYTPGIYADGYIVFAFPFVRLYVRSFVRSWNLRQSFALKFLKWCISQQLHIRKHSYSDHSYPGGLAFTP